MTITSKSQERRLKAMVDEGLKKWVIREFGDDIRASYDYGEPEETVAEDSDAEIEELTLNLQSYLKKEGYRKVKSEYKLLNGIGVCDVNKEKVTVLEDIISLDRGTKIAILEEV